MQGLRFVLEVLPLSLVRGSGLAAGCLRHFFHALALHFQPLMVQVLHNSVCSLSVTLFCTINHRSSFVYSVAT